MLKRIFLLMFGLLFGLATVAAAQNVISARAGFVNYKHGDVTLPVDRAGKALRQIEEGQTISTRHGRLELLLAPGSFLRLDHESEARLVSSRLQDVRLELLSGTATVEVNEIPKGTSLALVWREQTVPIARPGLYRFEAGPESMRIYVAKGKLQLAGMKDALKSSKYVDLTPAGTLTAATKYNSKDPDEFDRWNQNRGEQLAVASYTAANSFLRRPFSFRSSTWFLDPFFGFYTYLPYSYSVRSPYGFTYYCPRTVYHQASGGARGGGGTPVGGGGAGGGGQSGGSSGGSAPSAKPAPSGGGGSRVGGGEGRPSKIDRLNP